MKYNNHLIFRKKSHKHILYLNNWLRQVLLLRTAIFLIAVSGYSVGYAKGKNPEIDSAKNKDDKSYFSPLVFPGYTPEMGFNVGGGVLWSFKTKKGVPTLMRSSVPFGITFGFNGAISIKANWVTFWYKNKLRINSDWGLKNMDDNYFGVGYENGKNTEQSDSTSAYHKKWFQFDTRIVYEIEDNVFMGIRIDLNQTNATDPNPKMQEDPDYIYYGPNNYNSGIGIVIEHDSRDFPQNAYKGIYLSVMGTVYTGIFGGNNDYAVVDIDVRKYLALSDQKHRILAVWLRGKISGGEVPYNELPQFGANDLRGYYWGQYRDKTLGYLIAEYRHKFYKKNDLPSKLGMVFWVGGGGINEDFGQINLKNTLPNFGFGLRYELQPRLNVRFDCGFGMDTQLVYFGFAEEF